MLRSSKPRLQHGFLHNFALVRFAWPLMLSAATVLPDLSVTGADIDTRPSSSSWLTSDQPCFRTWLILAVSSLMLVTVCRVRAVRSDASRRSCN